MLLGMATRFHIAYIWVGKLYVIYLARSPPASNKCESSPEISFPIKAAPCAQELQRGPPRERKRMAQEDGEVPAL